MRTVTRWLALLAASVGVACGSSTDAGAGAIDHLVFGFTAPRPYYPVRDTLHVFVRGVAANGTYVNPQTTTWRVVTPTLASVVGTRGIAHDTVGLYALHGGDAVVEAEMGGVTAQVTIPIHGLLHDYFIIDSSETWFLADTPHVVKYLTYVDDVFGGNNQDTVTLTIEPGSVVRFRTGAGLMFGDNNPGTLVIPPGAPVVMEADSGAPAAPSWLGLHFKKSRSQLRNLVLRHCGATWPFDREPACVLAIGGEMLIDGVTIQNARNGLGLFGVTIDTASRNLSVHNTAGYVAKVSADMVDRFPLGGQFSGNDGSEILITGGRVTRSVTWGGLPLPLRLSQGATFDDPSNPILTLPPGFSLRADPGAGLFFPTGGLRAGETGAAPVILQSTGQGWPGIVIEHGATSVLKNVELRDCGTPTGYPWAACLVFGPSTGTDTGIVMQNVVIRDSRTAGLSVYTGGVFQPSSSNLTITGSATYPVLIFPWGLSTLPEGDYSGNGIDAILVGGGALYDSLVLRPQGVPYRFLDGLATNSVLFIEPGVTIEVGVGKMITAGYRNFVAVGTASEPIVFRSVTPGVAGSWFGFYIGVDNAGPGTRFDHVVIADAGAASPGYGSAIRLGSDPGGLLRNSTIIRSTGCGLLLPSSSSWTDDYTDPAFGNTFTDNVGAARCQMPF